MQVNANAMQSISTWMNNSAHNVANVNTQDFSASRTAMSKSGDAITAQTSQLDKQTSLAKEMTDQIEIEKTFEANAKAIKSKDEMIGSLLDLTI